ncbi:hypothetical protein I552_9608 [Mycobacterium xenopi 3993]|nr:hypothetical protein I552_9608 [Mycobacterium xenopi 3993]
MTVKPLATGVATIAAITAAAAGLTSVADSVSSQPQPVAVSAPLPLDPPPAPNLPSAEQLTDLCNQVTNRACHTRPR